MYFSHAVIDSADLFVKTHASLKRNKGSDWSNSLEILHVCVFLGSDTITLLDQFD